MGLGHADEGVELDARRVAELDVADVALLRTWIRQGAPWGRHWAYEPVTRPPVPAHGEANPIDNFLLERLKQERLAFSPEAGREVLIRRLALDVTGLPPTPAELDALVGKSPAEIADHYLAQPAYGEHWARPWLDLARYADSAGYPSDPGREIWAYRDWVVDAFNAKNWFRVEGHPSQWLDYGDGQKIRLMTVGSTGNAKAAYELKVVQKMDTGCSDPGAGFYIDGLAVPTNY